MDRKARPGKQIAFFLGIMILIISCSACAGVPNQGAATTPNAAATTPDALRQETSGFERAFGPIDVVFPEDHGPHPGFMTEWWYYTGNLATESGRHFGYQLTFFRRALAPEGNRPERSSAWATDQIYLAHFALTDIVPNDFHAHERFARGAAGLAGASSPPYKVWLHDWKVEQTARDTFRLYAEQEDIKIDLRLRDIKGPVLQGNQGFSQKGPQPGNASIYISQTRLDTSGTIQIADQRFPVSGYSWMDHEFSTSALSEDQVGWDWFALQLDDGTELMVFNLRKEDGTIDPFSSGTYIDREGTTWPLAREDFSIEVLDTWRSPHSNALYPAQWRLSVPKLQLQLEIGPHLADQELNLTFIYWEGAVLINGEKAGTPVQGNGYVELTGYAGSFAGDF
jgi:predicted secreted hydrolase